MERRLGQQANEPALDTTKKQEVRQLAFNLTPQAEPVKEKPAHADFTDPHVRTKFVRAYQRLDAESRKKEVEETTVFEAGRNP